MMLNSHLEMIETICNKISCLTKNKITYWEKSYIAIFASEILMSSTSKVPIVNLLLTLLLTCLMTVLI